MPSVPLTPSLMDIFGQTQTGAAPAATPNGAGTNYTAPVDTSTPNTSSVVPPGRDFTTFADPNTTGINNPTVMDGLVSDANSNNFDNYTAPGGFTNPENWKTYSETGQPLMGIPFAPRVTQVNDATGTRTEFVMPPDKPDLNTGNKILDTTVNGAAGLLGGAARIAGGSALQAAKSIGSFGEWDAKTGLKNAPVLNAIPNTLGLIDALAGTHLSDPSINYVDQHFATMPAADKLEQAAMNVGGFALGFAGGDKGAAEVDKTLGLSQGATQLIRSTYNYFAQTNPQNAMRATDVVVKSLLSEEAANTRLSQAGNALIRSAGGNLGGTLTENPNDPSISQQMLHIGGDNPSGLDNRVGQFLDNMAMSGLFKAIGTGLKFGVVKPVAGIGDAFGRPNEKSVAINLMQSLDPNITKNTPYPIIVDRMQKFSDMLLNNKDVPLNFTTGNDVYSRDTMGAVYNGANDYVRSAYSFMQPKMTPDQWDSFVANTSDKIVNTLQSMKRKRLMDSGSNASIVANSDMQAFDQGNNILGSVADKIMPKADATQAMQNTATPVITDLNQARAAHLTAEQAANAADLHLQNTQNANPITNLLAQINSDNKLTSPIENDKAIANLGQTVLPQRILEDSTNVNDAYNAIKGASQGGDTVDHLELAKYIKSLGDQNSMATIFGIPAPERNIAPIGNDVFDETGNLIHSPTQDLAKQLQDKNVDLKTLITEVKPTLSNLINQAMLARKAGNAKINVDDLIGMRNYINDLEAQSTDPAVQRAKNLYSNFANTWTETPELAHFAQLSNAGHLRDTGKVSFNDFTGQEAPVVAGESNQQIAGYKAIKAALTANDGGVTLGKTMQALGADSPSMGSLVVPMALRAVSDTTNAGSRVISSTDLRNAVSQYLPALEQSAPGSYQLFQQTYDALKAAEDGKANMQDALKLAGTNSALLESKVKASQLSRFMDNLGNGTHAPPPNVSFTTNPDYSFRQLFNDPQAPSLIHNLLNDPEFKADPNLKDALKSQFLRYMQDKTLTKGAIGALDGDMVKAPSTAKIGDALSGFGNNTQPILKELFKDDPNTANAFNTLLNEVYNQGNLYSMKPKMTGSDTAYNMADPQSVNQHFSDLMRIMFGPLSRKTTILNTIWRNVVSVGENNAIEKARGMLDAMITDPNLIPKITASLANDPADARHYVANALARAYNAGVVLTQGGANAFRQSQQNNDWQSFASKNHLNLDDQTTKAFQ